MTQENEGTSGADDGENTNSSGDTSENPEGNDENSGKVDYSTFKKVLSEKKAMQRKLDTLLKDREESERKEKESREEYKELYENAKIQNDELLKKVTTHEERWQSAIKLNAFHEALGDGRKIDPKYSGFIDTDKILIDPDTNEIDISSVQKEVKRVIAEYPEIVKSTSGNRLPNESPSGKGTLTYEQWLKLPTAKEKKERRKEVID